MRAMVIPSLTATAFAAVAIAFARPGSKKEGPSAARVGCLAPDFHLEDTSGREWHLRGLAGEPLFLVFACGCADCHRLLGSLGRTANLPARVLVISSITPTDLARLVAGSGGGLVGLFDPFGNTALAYSSLHCPRLWALDSSQIIRYTDQPAHAAPAEVIRAAARAIAGPCLGHSGLLQGAQLARPGD